MNVKLSIFTNRAKERTGYVVYVGGKPVKNWLKSVSREGAVKDYILESLSKGLSACRGVVSHDDILYIEIQNRDLCSWLDGKVEYKGYESTLDDAFEALECLDCRYRFLFVKEPVAKRYVEEGKREESGSSLAEAFEGLLNME